jgi:hypothetical protein
MCFVKLKAPISISVLVSEAACTLGLLEITSKIFLKDENKLKCHGDPTASLFALFQALISPLDTHLGLKGSVMLAALPPLL